MVGFVDDDMAEMIRREICQALLPHECLHAADGDAEPAVQAAFLGLLDGAAEARRFEKLVLCLVQQFSTVGQNQHPGARPDAFFRDRGENDGLAGPGGQDQERFAVPLIPLPEDSVFRLLLIRAQRHAGAHQNLPGV